MNFGSMAGVVLVLVAVYFGAIAELPAQDVIFNRPSLILVIGGTIAAFLISFPLRSMTRIFQMTYRGFLRQGKDQKKNVVRDLVSLSKGVHSNPQNIQELELSHMFLREGLILTLDESLDNDDLEYVLRQRAAGFKREYNKDAKLLIALAKFPPAFGLLGSVTGIIAMLMNLGRAGKEVIGEGMAIALLTTFWGVAITNMLILPLSDFAQRCNKEDEELRDIIVEGLLLIRAKENPQVIARKLRSLLSLGERQDLADVQLSVLDGRIRNEDEIRRHG